MAYCTRKNLIDSFGKEEIEQLTDRNNIGKIDDIVLNKAIADADAEINAKLIGRYTVPLNPVPTIIVLKACDIARYLLYIEPTEQVRNRYKDAMSYLKDVRDDKEKLGVNSPAETSGGFRVAGKNSVSSTNLDVY